MFRHFTPLCRVSSLGIHEAARSRSAMTGRSPSTNTKDRHRNGLSRVHSSGHRHTNEAHQGRGQREGSSVNEDKRLQRDAVGIDHVHSSQRNTRRVRAERGRFATNSPSAAEARENIDNKRSSSSSTRAISARMFGPRNRLRMLARQAVTSLHEMVAIGGGGAGHQSEEQSLQSDRNTLARGSDVSADSRHAGCHSEQKSNVDTNQNIANEVKVKEEGLPRTKSASPAAVPTHVRPPHPRVKGVLPSLPTPHHRDGKTPESEPKPFDTILHIEDNLQLHVLRKQLHHNADILKHRKEMEILRLERNRETEKSNAAAALATRAMLSEIEAKLGGKETYERKPHKKIIFISPAEEDAPTRGPAGGQAEAAATKGLILSPPKESGDLAKTSATPFKRLVDLKKEVAAAAAAAAATAVASEDATTTARATTAADIEASLITNDTYATFVPNVILPPRLARKERKRLRKQQRMLEERVQRHQEELLKLEKLNSDGAADNDGGTLFYSPIVRPYEAVADFVVLLTSIDSLGAGVREGEWLLLKEAAFTLLPLCSAKSASTIFRILGSHHNVLSASDVRIFLNIISSCPSFETKYLGEDLEMISADRAKAVAAAMRAEEERRKNGAERETLLSPASEADQQEMGEHLFVVRRKDEYLDDEADEGAGGLIGGTRRDGGQRRREGVTSRSIIGGNTKSSDTHYEYATRGRGELSSPSSMPRHEARLLALKSKLSSSSTTMDNTKPTDISVEEARKRLGGGRRKRATTCTDAEKEDTTVAVGADRVGLYSSSAAGAKGMAYTCHKSSERKGAALGDIGHSTTTTTPRAAAAATVLDDTVAQLLASSVSPSASGGQRGGNGEIRRGDVDDSGLFDFDADGVSLVDPSFMVEGLPSVESDGNLLISAKRRVPRSAPRDLDEEDLAVVVSSARHRTAENLHRLKKEAELFRLTVKNFMRSSDEDTRLLRPTATHDQSRQHKRDSPSTWSMTPTYRQSSTALSQAPSAPHSLFIARDLFYSLPLEGLLAMPGKEQRRFLYALLTVLENDSMQSLWNEIADDNIDHHVSKKEKVEQGCPSAILSQVVAVLPWLAVHTEPEMMGMVFHIFSKLMDVSVSERLVLGFGRGGGKCVANTSYHHNITPALIRDVAAHAATLLSSKLTHLGNDPFLNTAGDTRNNSTSGSNSGSSSDGVDGVVSILWHANRSICKAREILGLNDASTAEKEEKEETNKNSFWQFPLAKGLSATVAAPPTADQKQEPPASAQAVADEQTEACNFLRDVYVSISRLGNTVPFSVAAASIERGYYNNNNPSYSGSSVSEIKVSLSESALSAATAAAGAIITVYDFTMFQQWLSKTLRNVFLRGEEEGGGGEGHSITSVNTFSSSASTAPSSSTSAMASSLVLRRCQPTPKCHIQIINIIASMAGGGRGYDNDTSCSHMRRFPPQSSSSSSPKEEGEGERGGEDSAVFLSSLMANGLADVLSWSLTALRSALRSAASSTSPAASTDSTHSASEVGQMEPFCGDSTATIMLRDLSIIAHRLLVSSYSSSSCFTSGASTLASSVTFAAQYSGVGDACLTADIKDTMTLLILFLLRDSAAAKYSKYRAADALEVLRASEELELEKARNFRGKKSRSLAQKAEPLSPDALNDLVFGVNMYARLFLSSVHDANDESDDSLVRNLLLSDSTTSDAAQPFAAACSLPLGHFQKRIEQTVASMACDIFAYQEQEGHFPRREKKAEEKNETVGVDRDGLESAKLILLLHGGGLGNAKSNTNNTSSGTSTGQSSNLSLVCSSPMELVGKQTTQQRKFMRNVCTRVVLEHVRWQEKVTTQQSPSALTSSPPSRPVSEAQRQRQREIRKQEAEANLVIMSRAVSVLAEAGILSLFPRLRKEALLSTVTTTKETSLRSNRLQPHQSKGNRSGSREEHERENETIAIAKKTKKEALLLLYQRSHAAFTTETVLTALNDTLRRKIESISSLSSSGKTPFSFSSNKKGPKKEIYFFDDNVTFWLWAFYTSCLRAPPSNSIAKHSSNMRGEEKSTPQQNAYDERQQEEKTQEKQHTIVVSQCFRLLELLATYLEQARVAVIADELRGVHAPRSPSPSLSRGAFASASSSSKKESSSSLTALKFAMYQEDDRHHQLTHADTAPSSDAARPTKAAKSMNMKSYSGEDASSLCRPSSAKEMLMTIGRFLVAELMRKGVAEEVCMSLSSDYYVWSRMASSPRGQRHLVSPSSPPSTFDCHTARENMLRCLNFLARFDVSLRSASGESDHRRDAHHYHNQFRTVDPLAFAFAESSVPSEMVAMLKRSRSKGSCTTTAETSSVALGGSASFSSVSFAVETIILMSKEKAHKGGGTEGEEGFPSTRSASAHRAVPLFSGAAFTPVTIPPKYLAPLRRGDELKAYLYSSPIGGGGATAASTIYQNSNINANSPVRSSSSSVLAASRFSKLPCAARLLAVLASNGDDHPVTLEVLITFIEDAINEAEAACSCGGGGYGHGEVGFSSSQSIGESPQGERSPLPSWSSSTTTSLSNLIIRETHVHLASSLTFLGPWFRPRVGAIVSRLVAADALMSEVLRPKIRKISMSRPTKTQVDDGVDRSAATISSFSPEERLCVLFSLCASIDASSLPSIDQLTRQLRRGNVHDNKSKNVADSFSSTTTAADDGVSPLCRAQLTLATVSFRGDSSANHNNRVVAVSAGGEAAAAVGNDDGPICPTTASSTCILLDSAEIMFKDLFLQGNTNNINNNSSSSAQESSSSTNTTASAIGGGGVDLATINRLLRGLDGEEALIRLLVVSHVLSQPQISTTTDCCYFESSSVSGESTSSQGPPIDSLKKFRVDSSVWTPSVATIHLAEAVHRQCLRHFEKKTVMSHFHQSATAADGATSSSTSFRVAGLGQGPMQLSNTLYRHLLTSATLVRQGNATMALDKVFADVTTVIAGSSVGGGGWGGEGGKITVTFSSPSLSPQMSSLLASAASTVVEASLLSGCRRQSLSRLVSTIAEVGPLGSTSNIASLPAHTLANLLAFIHTPAEAVAIGYDTVSMLSVGLWSSLDLRLSRLSPDFFALLVPSTVPSSYARLVVRQSIPFIPYFQSSVPLAAVVDLARREACYEGGRVGERDGTEEESIGAGFGEGGGGATRGFWPAVHKRATELMTAAGGPVVLQEWADEREALRMGVTCTNSASDNEATEVEGRGRPHPEPEKEALLNVFERLEEASGACDISFSL